MRILHNLQINTQMPLLIQKEAIGDEFAQGQMDPSFHAVMFFLKPGEISDTVEIPFGFHVIKRFE